MLNILLATLEYSEYIAPYKLVLFLLFFFLWIWLITWLYHDALNLRMGSVFWTSIVFVIGAVGALIWMLIPIFMLGMLLYLIAIGMAFIIYVVQRDATVAEIDRILTVGHIKRLFNRTDKKSTSKESIVFVTANGNEVPVPESRTVEFFGYKKACELFRDAIWHRATEVILSPTSGDYTVIYYVDGTALKQPEIDKEQMEYFIGFIKQVADLNVKEKRRPQNSKFEIHKNDTVVTWGINTAGSTVGEQIKFKQMALEGILKLSDFGLNQDIFEQFNAIRDNDHGLFIVAGPPKTGVTTTFYGLLRNHDAYLNSINTLEKRPSGVLPNIIQTIFSLSDTGRTTYAGKLREIMGTDPTILGIADCADGETAKMICKIVEQGKLVYITLEADNVLQALGKWIKLVGNKDAAVRNLIGISNQRLIRKLCSECKEGYEPNRGLLKKFNIPAERAKVFYRADRLQQDRRGRSKICDTCQGIGYVGRMPVFETITINDELRAFINQTNSLSEINSKFRSAKMLFLQEQALKEVVAGSTSVNEMIRVFSTSKKVRRPIPKK